MKYVYLWYTILPFAIVHDRLVFYHFNETAHRTENPKHIVRLI